MAVSRKRFDYDVAVVGGGSAGYAAARTSVARGLKTAVIEGGREVGGLCILRGCMPTKALLYAADVFHLIQKAPLWGLRASSAGLDFAKVMARKDRLIREFAEDRRAQLKSGEFDFIRAQARFRDAHTLILPDGRLIRAGHFVIATGSIVAPPPIPSLSGVGYLTSDDALALERLPESLLVLGGGPVAVEFAQLFHRFGVRVTVVQRSPHLLRDFDADTVTVLEEVFREEGMGLHTGVELLEAWQQEERKGVTFRQEGEVKKTDAEEIFFGLGRNPNTRTLGLEEIGVVTERGRIVTNNAMQSSVPHIYAAGDCASPYEIVHLAVQQGEIAALNIAAPHRVREIDYRLLINAVFTEPQLATVGLTEKAAQEQCQPVAAARYSFGDHGKSMIMDAIHGFVKLLADPDSGEILGGGCTGPMASDLIHEIVAAMAKRMTVSELAAMPHYHPTLAEIWTYPAEELAAQIPKPKP